MRTIYNFLIDRWLLYRAWRVRRIELADVYGGRLEAERKLREAERERHEREEARLKDEIAIGQEQIKSLTAANAELYAIIKRNTALYARDEAVAQVLPNIAR